MKIINLLYKPVIFIAFFVAEYLLTQVILSHSDAKNAYSLMNAWWLSLYACTIVGAKFKNLTLSFPITFIMLTLLHVTGMGDNLYHDAPTTFSTKLLFVAFMQSIIIVSPIFVNFVVHFIIKPVNRENHRTSDS